MDHHGKTLCKIHAGQLGEADSLFLKKNFVLCFELNPESQELAILSCTCIFLYQYGKI